MSDVIDKEYINNKDYMLGYAISAMEGACRMIGQNSDLISQTAFDRLHDAIGCLHALRDKKL